MEWIEGASWLDVLTKNLYPPEISVLEPAVREVLYQSAQRGCKVLDVGCGNGRFSEYLTGLDTIVTAVDLDEELIRVVKSKGIDSRKADVRELPFEDGYFDYVLSSMVLNAVPEYGKAINEMARVLRKEGKGLIAVTHPLLGEQKKYHSEHVIEIPFDGGSFFDIHRPLSYYVNTLVGSGLYVVGVREPETKLKGFPNHEYLLLEIQKQEARV